MEDKLLEVISEAMDNKCSVYITVGEKGEFLITLRKNKFSVDNTVSKEYRDTLPKVIKNMIENLNEMFNDRIKNLSQVRIVVYRSSKKDITNVINRVDKFLTYEYNKKFTRKKNVITVGKIKIFFFSGNIMKMSGTSPHFYNSDDTFASDFLKMEGFTSYAQNLPKLNDLFDLIRKGV